MMFATTDSVVSSVDATLVAFCRALLVTFAGSRIPAFTMSTYSSLYASNPMSRLGLSYFVDDDSAFQSGVGNDVEQRSLQSFQHYVCTCLLVTFQRVSKFCHFLGSVDVCGTAACDDTFLNGCPCSCKSVLHAEFCLFHLCLCGSSYTDYCNAACQFGKSLL